MSDYLVNVRNTFDFENWGGVVKTHIENLDKIDTDGLHEILVDNDQKILCFIKNFKKISQLKKVVISFNGAVSNREKKKGPFFTFLGVAERLDIPVISFSDPSTMENEKLGLAWYAGNQNFLDLPQKLGNIINNYCESFGILPILVGGSGGGFAVLNISRYLNVDANLFVWNPQTDINKYYKRHVESYYRCAFPEDAKLSIQDTISLIKKKNINFNFDVNFDRIFLKQNLLYLQNKSDQHYEIHALPFLKKNKFNIASENIQIRNNMYFLSPNWGDGHIEPPIYAVEYIVNELIKGNSIENLVYNIPRIFDDFDFSA